MKSHSGGQPIAELAEGAAIQAEVARDRLALEWGQIVVTRLLSVWKQLDNHESLAYEDKVAAQAHILDEAAASLWHLHKALTHTHRILKTHHQQLQQSSASLAAS